MSLKIIVGSKDLDKFIEGKEYVDQNDDYFNERYDESWLKDPFIARALSKLDNIDMACGHVFHNSITGDFHSEKELSTSCKTTILIHKYPGIVFRARFGDNCNKFIEQIATRHDIMLHDYYDRYYDFEFIREIEIVNYNKAVHNNSELMNLYFDYWEYERNNETKDEEPEDKETEDE